MSEWNKVRLGDCCNIFTGKKDVNQTSKDGTYRFFSCAPTTFWSEEYIYDGDAIIVAGNGSYTGRTQFYSGKFDLYQRTYACVVQNVDFADIRFLYYAMKAFFEPVTLGGKRGAAIPYIVKSNLTDFEISLPPLSTQRRIASILSNYDSAIANCRRQIVLLEEAAMRFYKECFKDGKGEKKKIGDICSIIGAGGTPSRRNSAYWNKGTIPWYKTGELKDTWLYDAEEKITEAGLAGSAAKVFPAETVLMAIYASPTLGRLGILDKPGCCNQATLCFCPNTSMASWQWLYCKLFDLRDAFNAIARGAGQQNISGVVVKEYPILLPTPEAMASFTEKVSLMFSATRSLGRQIHALTEARDRLLPKLMKGEIAV